ncbi:MAG: hypothetical protein GX083_02685 [Clostridiales bacterium]|nr:hypothetical protein [Clostridiales bacterium]
MKRKWLISLIIYLMLIVMCALIVYAVPSVKGLLEKTYITENGEISVTDDIEAYIVRDETVYVAKQAATVNRLADPDKLIKGSTKVVEMSGEGLETKSNRYTAILSSLGKAAKKTSNGISKEAGYVSYYLDGAEGKLTTDRLNDLKKSDFESLTDLPMKKTINGKCAAGDPLFKVSRNAKWYLVFYIDKDRAEKYTEGKTVNIDMNGKDVDVKVYSVTHGKKQSKIILSCKSYFVGLLKIRRLNTRVTYESGEGLLIRNSSIVEKNGRKGVIIKNKFDEHIFRPIAVKADDGKQSAIYSDLFVDKGGHYVETVSVYDEIVTSPTEKVIKESL